MKHILQWKFLLITFISLLCGVAALAASQAIVFGYFYGMSAEEAEVAAESYSILFSSLFIIVVIVVFQCLSRRIIMRIEVMNKNVEKIARGNVEMLSDVKVKDELGSLSRNINEMARKIQESLDREREMVCTVAHDLRTPVTSIQGYARLLETSLQLSEEHASYVAIIEQKSIALSKQIDELLEYSVLQFEEKEYTFEQISLSKLIEQVVVEFIPQLEQQQMTFSLKGNQTDCIMYCNQTLMIRLFENLMNNSIRYAKKEKTIDIEIKEMRENYSVTVSNDADVFAENELEHLFDAFYHGKGAENYRTESKGLGLAIVRKIVAIHQGTVEVENRDERIIFHIEFPKDVSKL